MITALGQYTWGDGTAVLELRTTTVYGCVTALGHEGECMHVAWKSPGQHSLSERVCW